MNDIDIEEEANVIIDFTHRVNLIRFRNDLIVPSRLKIRAEVFASETAQEIDFDITFAKIKFWFETVVSKSVVFSRSNGTAMDMLLNEAGQPRLINHLMVTPYEPTDEHLAVLFQSKMSALSNGTVEFGGIRVEVEEAGLVFTYIGDWRDDLPSMSDWFDVKPYYFEEPWWQRNDASTLDVIAPDADLTKLPSWAYKMDFIENAIRPRSNPKPTAAEDVVIRGAFRPKVIDGGKDNVET